MARITIEFVIDESVERGGPIEPALDDPHNVADELCETYNEWAAVNGKAPIKFNSAEWR